MNKVMFFTHLPMEYVDVFSLTLGARKLFFDKKLSHIWDSEIVSLRFLIGSAVIF